MDIINILQNRYSTKQFDNSKSLTSEDILKIKAILQLSPSSVNLQPWHFILASSKQGKKQLISNDKMFDSNHEKLLDCSVVVVFCYLENLTQEYLNKITEKEDKDGRFIDQTQKTESHESRKMFSDYHDKICGDFTEWSKNQVFINLGNFLVSIASLGFDSVAIEGLNFDHIDKEFSLKAKGYKSCCAVAIGYAKDGDYNKVLPKSRLEINEIIQEI